MPQNNSCIIFSIILYHCQLKQMQSTVAQFTVISHYLTFENPWFERWIVTNFSEKILIMQTIYCYSTSTIFSSFLEIIYNYRKLTLVIQCFSFRISNCVRMFIYGIYLLHFVIEWFLNVTSFVFYICHCFFVFYRLLWAKRVQMRIKGAAVESCAVLGESDLLLRYVLFLPPPLGVLCFQSCVSVSHCMHNLVTLLQPGVSAGIW